MSNMVVRTNIFALNAHRNMKNVGLEQGRASNRLSSGFRINSAADDAAGLAISENMRAQIRGLDQASRNAQDGQAMLLTTEGGLEEIGNMLQRVRELMVQASNDTNTQNQRAMIEREVNQLAQEISSMQERVEFNTNRVLSMGPAMASGVSDALGNLERDQARVSEAFSRVSDNRAAVSVAREMLNQVESSSTAVGSLNARQQQVINDALGVVSLAGTVTTTPGVPAAGTTAATVTVGNTGTTATIAAGDASLPATITALGAVTSATVQTVADFQTFLNNRDVALDNAVTSLNDVRAMMENVSSSITGGINTFRGAISTGNNVAFFQVGANAHQGIQYDFENVSRAVSSAASTVQLASLMVANPSAGTGIGSGIRVTEFISALQTSLDDISTVRADLGAVQNRMDYTMRSLDISSENLQDSESRVRNADVAREMMRFTMANVLQQAAVSMLSQANQMPNNLLQLLR